MRTALVLSAFVLVGLLILVFVPGISQRGRAQIGSADSVGFLSPFYFESDYVFTWVAYDCIEARLYYNAVLQTSESIGCYSGGTWVGYLDAAPGSGTYQLQLWSTYYSVSEYSRSWTTPGFAMSVSASSSTANVGDTVGINAKLTLSVSGPDYFSDSGSLNVSAVSTVTQDVAFTIVSAHYLSYYGLAQSPLYGEVTFLVPISFGTAGTKSISVQYADPFGSASGSLSVTIADPRAAQIAAIQAELASLEANETANATRLAHLSGEIAALQATTSANDTEDRAALALLAAQVSQLWAKLNATQSNTASVQSAAATTNYVSVAAVVMAAAGLALGAMAYRKAGKRKPE
jgi:hypothetical protein